MRKEETKRAKERERAGKKKLYLNILFLPGNLDLETDYISFVYLN